MKTTSLFFLGAIAATAACSSDVTGGGGGAGGAGSTAQATTTGNTAQATTDGSAEASVAVGTSSAVQGSGGGDVTSVGGGDTTSAGGNGAGGGENLLGECVFESGTGSSSGSGGGGSSSGCDVTYTCDAGTVDVSCFSDGTTESCTCSLSDGGSGRGGTCDNTDFQGCSFPQGCCFELLGGQAEPNLGPYGTCEDAGGSSAQSGGGTTLCGSAWTCDGGDMTIECEGDANGAFCECIDDQSFLIGTCRQEMADCDYVTGCCYDVFNP